MGFFCFVSLDVLNFGFEFRFVVLARAARFAGFSCAQSVSVCVKFFFLHIFHVRFYVTLIAHFSIIT